MATIARRRTSPVADIFRLEDYVEETTYVLRAEMPGIDPDKDVQLPRGTKAEDIEATYADGVLELRIQFDGEEAQPLHIPVTRPQV